MAEQGLVLTFKKKNRLEFSDLESIGLIRICSKIGRECILSSKERYGVSLSCILAAQKNRSGSALQHCCNNVRANKEKYQFFLLQ